MGTAGHVENWARIIQGELVVQESFCLAVQELGPPVESLE